MENTLVGIRTYLKKHVSEPVYIENPPSDPGEMFICLMTERPQFISVLKGMNIRAVLAIYGQTLEDIETLGNQIIPLLDESYLSLDETMVPYVSMYTAGQLKYAPKPYMGRLIGSLDFNYTVFV